MYFEILEFVELQSCYDDILRNMPDDYMQTVQTLERYLCDLHVSTIFECSSVSDANKTILECLTENALCKEHVLEFCERLLKITDASKLRSMIENLRECKYSYYICMYVCMCNFYNTKYVYNRHGAKCIDACTCTYKLCYPHDTPTFKNEALRLISNVQLVKHLILRNEWLTQHYLALL